LASINLVSNQDNIYEIINLGSGRPLTLNDMVDTISGVVGKEAIKHSLPMQPGDVNQTYADISKAEKLLNYRVSCSFSSGIQKFYKWYIEGTGSK